MPAKASRVRRWLKAGKAKVVHNDLGIFQVQLTQPPSGAAIMWAFRVLQSASAVAGRVHLPNKSVKSNAANWV